MGPEPRGQMYLKSVLDRFCNVLLQLNRAGFSMEVRGIPSSCRKCDKVRGVKNIICHCLDRDLISKTNNNK